MGYTGSEEAGDFADSMGSANFTWEGVMHNIVAFMDCAYVCNLHTVVHVYSTCSMGVNGWFQR